eukprot:scaffold6749_cov113-Cylindrotheca_fusiformis.AAC.5
MTWWQIGSSEKENHLRHGDRKSAQSSRIEQRRLGNVCTNHLHNKKMELKNYFSNLAIDIGASKLTLVPDHALSHEPRSSAHSKLGESPDTLSIHTKQHSRNGKISSFNRMFDQVDRLAPRFPCRRDSPDTLSIERKRHDQQKKRINWRGDGVAQLGRIHLRIDDNKSNDQSGNAAQRPTVRSLCDSSIVDAPKCPVRRGSEDDLLPRSSLIRRCKSWNSCNTFSIDDSATQANAEFPPMKDVQHEPDPFLSFSGDLSSDMQRGSCRCTWKLRRPSRWDSIGGL